MIPYTTERRADTGLTNVTMGVWLFLASEVMLFGSLFSAYALLRTTAASWPSGRSVLQLSLGVANTVVLFAMTAAAWRARASRPAAGRTWLFVSTALALAFLTIKGIEYRREIVGGLVPAASTFLATYFLLTGLHALHVAGGAIANVWTAAGASRVGEAMTAGRLRALSLYWTFVDIVWVAIFVVTYLS